MKLLTLLISGWYVKNPFVYLTVPVISVSISAPYGEITSDEPGILGDVVVTSSPNDTYPLVLTYIIMQW